MSGIGCVGSSPGSTNIQLQLAYNSSSASETSNDVDAARKQRLNGRLEESLANAGVDDQTASAIEAEIQQAFQANQDSGQFPPSPESMKQTVDGIFAKYGLDAGEILGPPPGRGPHPPANYGSSSDSEDATTTLADLLQQLADQGATPDELAKMFSDAIAGLDQSV